MANRAPALATHTIRGTLPSFGRADMDIAQTLGSYDGKRVAPFHAVPDAVQDTPGEAIPQLLDLAGGEEPALQVGATWVRSST